MKYRKVSLQATAIVLAAVTLSAQGQNGGADSYGQWDERSGQGIRPKSWLPYTSYGYVGGGIGRSDYDQSGCAFSCDNRATGFKVFTGGQFSRVFGAEVSYVHLGEVDRNGGDLRGHGLNLSLIANAPLGERFNLFGKVGGIYGWTRASGVAPGFQRGHEDGFGLSYGAGLQFDFNRNWAIRGDWDRYRLRYVDGRDDADLYSIGIIYKF